MVNVMPSCACVYVDAPLVKSPVTCVRGRAGWDRERECSQTCGRVYDRSRSGPLWRELARRRECRSIVVRLWGGAFVVRAVAS